MSKEKRIRSITNIYYSNPKIQEAIFNFSKDREVIPRYFEGFGKRPDTIQYPSDIKNLVAKGATSFHASEEIWKNPLEINSDMSQSEMSEIRKSWDLLIDIDSPFLDYSKIAAISIIEELEAHGIENYGIKFSGSKGFHIIVPASAFPESFQDQETKKMFPEWPRAISQYLMYKIRSKYNKEVTKLDINFDALKERTKLSKEDVTETICPNCEKSAKKGIIVKYECPECKSQIQRPNSKITKRKLMCTNNSCPGYLEVVEKRDYFYCENCNYSSFDKKLKSDKKVIHTKAAKQGYSQDFEEQISGEKIASLDLVLVAPRHLFRSPYSLHEKTSLASAVITKDQIHSFAPKDANPLKVKVLNFYPSPKPGEATQLLESAVEWKKTQEDQEDQHVLTKKYKNFEKINIETDSIPEDLFPKPIKKLLKGLPEGRKRGLFVLLTFLRSLNFSPEYINSHVREWNKLNDPPLKEGYVKSQIDWHLKQKKQILPPNYKNDNFYKDLKLLDVYPKDKNPIPEVLRKVRKNNN